MEHWFLQSSFCWLHIAWPFETMVVREVLKWTIWLAETYLNSKFSKSIDIKRLSKYHQRFTIVDVNVNLWLILVFKLQTEVNWKSCSKIHSLKIRTVKGGSHASNACQIKSRALYAFLTLPCLLVTSKNTLMTFASMSVATSRFST